MVFDKSFRAAVCVATKAISHQVDTRVQDDGSATVTVRRTLPAEVPDFVKKFVGETIELIQSETWAADDGSGVRRADLTLEVVGQPATMTGSIILEATTDGVHEVVHGELKVAVPFFGGKIETEIAKGSRRGGPRRGEDRPRVARRPEPVWLTDPAQQGWHHGSHGPRRRHVAAQGGRAALPGLRRGEALRPDGRRRGELAEYCCTWCGAGLLIDPSATHPASPRHVA